MDIHSQKAMLRYLSQSFRTLFISAVATPAHGSPNFYLQFAKNTPCPSTKYFYSGPGRTTDPVEPFSDADATTTPVIPPPRKYRKWPLADSAFVKKEVDRAKAACKSHDGLGSETSWQYLDRAAMFRLIMRVVWIQVLIEVHGRLMKRHL